MNKPNPSAPKKYSILVSQTQTGLRLDRFLAEWIPGVSGEELSNSKVRKLIQMGFVFLNGARCKIASKELHFKSRVEVFLDARALNEGDQAKESDRAFALTAQDVLFEDDAIIVMNKPFGLPTQPTLDRNRPCLYTSLIRFLSERDGKPAYVGLHHRLDRDTSGVILFTKKKEANVGVSRIFKEHLAQKSYVALTLGGSQVAFQVGDVWQIDNFLGKKNGPKKSSMMRAVRSGGDRAITDFKLLDQSRSARLIQAQPKTGRMHQIRVHLSESGLPILGDRIYGTPNAPRLMLHARALAFPHPLSAKSLQIEAPLPQDFEKCMKDHGLRLPSSLT